VRADDEVERPVGGHHLVPNLRLADVAEKDSFRSGERLDVAMRVSECIRPGLGGSSDVESRVPGVVSLALRQIRKSPLP
jgi:hypothetical protein